jgi:hypothetical protein
LVLVTGYQNGMLRVWDGINALGVKREWLTFKTPGAEEVSPTILNLACWVCGTHPSTLERESARGKEIGKPQ